jgi:hypothetical protein
VGSARTSMRERLLPREQTRAAQWMAALAALEMLAGGWGRRLLQAIPDQTGMYALPPGWLGVIGVAVAFFGLGASIAWAAPRWGAPYAALGFLCVTGAVSAVSMLITIAAGGPPDLEQWLFEWTGSQLATLALVAGVAVAAVRVRGGRLRDALGLADRQDPDTRLAWWAALLVVLPSIPGVLVASAIAPFREALYGSPDAPGWSQAFGILNFVGLATIAAREAAVFLVAFLGVRRWSAPRALWFPMVVGYGVVGLTRSVDYAAGTVRSGLGGRQAALFAGLGLLSAIVAAAVPVAAVSLAVDRDAVLPSEPEDFSDSATIERSDAEAPDASAADPSTKEAR